MEYKTNVMRLLDKLKVKYNHYSYVNTNAISGVDVANVLGQNPEKVFKTLVTVGKTKQIYVFMLPVAEELDLKKAAKSVAEKSVEMLKSKDLLSTVGYVHGGCSPIGMKKNFRTTVHKSVKDFESIIFSAGKIGYQVELALDELKKVIEFSIADIIV